MFELILFSPVAVFLVFILVFLNELDRFERKFPKNSVSKNCKKGLQ